MQRFLVVKHLPTEIAVELGQLVPLYTHIQWQLTNLVCLLLGIDAKQGRVAVREYRLDEYITTVEHLCAIKKIKMSERLSAMNDDFKRFDRDRNLYTHGIWLSNTGGTVVFVRATKGQNQTTATYKPAHKPRKLTPEAIPVTSEKLHNLRLEIDKATVTIRNASLEIRERLRALQNTDQK